MKIQMRVMNHEVCTYYNKWSRESHPSHMVELEPEEESSGFQDSSLKFWGATPETLAMLPVGKLVEVEIRDVPETQP